MGAGTPRLASGKLIRGDMAISVANAALQILGAKGYSDELPLERMARDARMFTIGGGTVEMQHDLNGREVIERAASPPRLSVEDRRGRAA